MANRGSIGCPAGDLYIEIRIKPHDIFERDGDDLHCQVPVKFYHRSLGRRNRSAHAGRQSRH